MKHSVIIPLSLFSFVLLSCGTTRYVPVREQVVVSYRDSVRYHDSTIFVTIPRERIVDVVSEYDTLKMETSVASALAYVDKSSHSLKGRIENKGDSIRTIIKWKEKIVTRDSLVYKEVPLPVEVPVEKIPKSYWVWLSISILALVYIIIKIILKIKK